MKKILLCCALITILFSCSHPARQNFEDEKIKFCDIDMNADGKISKDEWKLKFNDPFEIKDHNRDGIISQDEYHNTIKRKYPKKSGCGCS